MQNKNTNGMPQAKPVKLTEIIEYAEGSIVSRTLSKNDAGTLILFAFDVNEELSEHTAPFDAYVQLLDGKVWIKIGEQEITAIAGETVLMPANVPHALKAVEQFKMLLTMIRG